MFYPKISVITPSYNQGEFIRETILSVLGQDYPNLEYIVIDGGSTDSTVDIIKEFDSSLAYWVSEKDNGQSDAINKGFRKATGEVLMWLNSDDLLMPGALFLVAKKADVKTANLYFGNCIHFRNSNSLYAAGSDIIRNHKNYLLENYDFIIQPSSFWTKKTWELVGELNEGMHFAFDWEWFLRVNKLNIPFTSFPECISLYRIHARHKTGSGGTARDKEIAETYRIFSPGNEVLFNYLVEDKYFFNSSFLKMIRRITRFFFAFEAEVRLLRFFKCRKYKGYALKTIMQVKDMVAYYELGHH